MTLILGVGVNGCYSCPEGGSCKVTSTTKFPATMELDYVRIYKKENEAVYFIGQDEICYQGETSLKAPFYPGAVYYWETTDGLTLQPGQYLSFEGGIWKTAKANFK